MTAALAKRPTIKTICAMTGLSTATVSKALRGSEQVRPQTRAVVEEAARRVGYELNIHGLQLRTGKTFQIAAVLPAPSVETDEWEGVEYAQLLSGISGALEDTPYRVALYAVPSPQEALAVIRRLVDRREADGIILSGTRPEDARVAFLQERDFPFVTYGTTEAHGAHPFVDADNARMIRLSVERLAGRGHRRIALVNPPADMSYAATRLAAYREALAEHGIAFDPALVASDHLTPGFGKQAVMAMSRLADAPSAYICANEAAALGALSGFTACGLVHGRDAVINATDDLNVSGYFTPPLTTFYLPIGRPARLLGEFMLARLDNAPVESLQRMLMPEMIERSDDRIVPERARKAGRP